MQAVERLFPLAHADAHIDEIDQIVCGVAVEFPSLLVVVFG